MKVSAILKNTYHAHEVVVTTDAQSKHIPLPPKATGYGSSVNGAELLLLAIATCYCNDIYREAEKRNILVSEVEVACTADFGAAGEPGTHFQYKPVVTSNATPEQLAELLKATDAIAEIHKTLRQGVQISLLT